MSIKEQKGRTFLTKDEITEREEIIKSARGLDQQFYVLGQIVTSFFLKLDETKTATQYVNSIDKEFGDKIKEKYGNVKITEEGEVIPNSDDEGGSDNIEEVDAETI